MLLRWQIKTIVNYLVEHPLGDSLNAAVKPFLQYPEWGDRVRIIDYQPGKALFNYSIEIKKAVENLEKESFFRKTLNDNKALMVKTLEKTVELDFWCPNHLILAENQMMQFIVNWSDVKSSYGSINYGGRTKLREMVTKLIETLIRS